jgi:CHAT domain-containing protein/Flp pilus assembly protein TadD
LRRCDLWRVPLLYICTFLFACAGRRDPKLAFDRAESAFQKGDTEVAAREADAGYQYFHGASKEWAWRFTILKARTLSRQGRDGEVLHLLALEPGLPPTPELVVQEHRIEAVTYASLRRFPEAEEALSGAERICSAADYPTCPDVVRAQGFLQMHKAHYVEAQRLFERAWASAHSAGDRFLEATALLNLSWSAEEQAHFDEALDWANAARGIAVSQGFAGVDQTALGNMGWAYYKLGDPEKAKEMFIEAGRKAEKLGDVTDQVRWLTDGGYVYMDARDFKTAAQSFRQSLKLAGQISSRESIINSLIALAFVSEQTNKLDDAKRYADEALAKAKEDNNGRDQVYPLLVQGRIAARQHDNATAENTFREVAQSPDCPVFLKWEAERSLAGRYEDQRQFDAAGSEYRSALSTFEAARSELKHIDSRLPFLSNAARIYDDYIHLLVARGKTVEALQVADFSRGRTLNEGLGSLQKETSFEPGRVNAQQIAMRTNSTILFYWLGEQSSYLWAITPETIRLFPLPAAAEIEVAVERYGNAVEGSQDVLGSSNEDGRALYQMLIAPAKELLPPNANVIVIPDGKLNNLNFETLLVAEPKPHYWIEDVTITNASSLRLLAAAHSGKEKEKRARSLLLFGGAIASSPDYPELENATVEMNSVAKHFPAAQQKIFQRGQATPAAYLANHPEQFSYIHFVAHGIASRLSPLDSAIVLSRDSPENENFKLYARDIIQHPVRARLVTISACYGAGTRAYSGEGLVGLSWSFLRAGAHNVIAALWAASDVSTGQLMDEFYKGLDKKDSPAASLRKAKLSLLHSSSAYRKPFYWAPFQLYTGS